MNNSYLGGRLALSSIESKLNTIIKGGYVAVSGMIYSCWDRMLRRLYGPRNFGSAFDWSFLLLSGSLAFGID